MFLHGPIPEKFNLFYLRGAVAVWSWYTARLLIGFMVGITCWPRRWYLRGPLCGFLMMLPPGHHVARGADLRSRVHVLERDHRDVDRPHRRRPRVLGHRQAHSSRRTRRRRPSISSVVSHVSVGAGPQDSPSRAVRPLDVGSRTMTMPAFTLSTPRSAAAAIAWGERGIVGLQLPEAGERGDPRPPAAALSRRARSARRRRRCARALDAIAALLRGEAARPLGDHARHGRACRRSTAGSTRRRARSRPGRRSRTARSRRASASPGSARAVGQALGRNPFPIVVPCHRVLAAGGKTGRLHGDRRRRRPSCACSRSKGSTQKPNPQPELFDGDAGLGFDWQTAVAHLRAADPKLARVIDATARAPARPLELKKTPSLFGALAEAIVYQQLSGKAAATIYGRVCALFPRAPHGPDRRAHPARRRRRSSAAPGSRARRCSR